jgi:hypothetical protein
MPAHSSGELADKFPRWLDDAGINPHISGMKLTEQLLSVATTYCGAKSISLARVSTLIFNDGKRFDAIQRGGDLGTAQFEKALSWFSDNWPEADETWPLGVPRPAPARAES